MDESDKKHVGETLRSMCGAYRIKYGTDIFNGYWLVLKDMSRADFDRVVPLVMKTSTKGMPYPAEFFATERRGWL